MKEYSIPIIFIPFLKMRRNARAMHLLAGFMLVANAYGEFSEPDYNMNFMLFQFSFGLACVVFGIWGSKLFRALQGPHVVFRVAEILLLGYAAIYFFSKNLILIGSLQTIAAAGLVILFLNERNIFGPALLLINNEGLWLPALNSKKLLAWKEIDNMIVRYDFVSINTKQNQFIQFELASDLKTEEIDEINEFCRLHFAVPEQM